jgi:ribosomal protein RSM22 (predicted rRNA methylase)
MRVLPGAGDARDAFLAAIEAELGERARPELKEPAAALSRRYRSENSSVSGGGFGTGERHAYLATRVPATFATTRRVLAELAGVSPAWPPESLIDLGAGPGTATWAAVDVFGPVRRALLVERDASMASLGARLAGSGLNGLVTDLKWVRGDAACLELPESDLVVASYLLGELGRDREMAALGNWWGATRSQLVIVEPGTPTGFERLRAARSTLVAWGAHVAAPCPHDGPCPMEGSDWCHFAVRIDRSALHRDLKGARLGYEDEKYSYLVASREHARTPVARLVRSPRLHKGHVRLVVCEAAGLNERVVSRRDGELYRCARDARWGDRLKIDSPI